MPAQTPDLAFQLHQLDGSVWSGRLSEIEAPLDVKADQVVMMLHGLGSKGVDWIFQLEALKGLYQMLTVDLPGHGDSPIPSGWPTMADMARDLRTLLMQLGIPSLHLVGLSLGGGIALQLAVDYPELARTVTVVNASATLGGGAQRLPSSVARLGLLLFGKMDWLGRWVAGGLFPRVDQQELREVAEKRIAENSRMSYIKAVAAVLRFNLSDRLGAITRPTLVVAGSNDRTVTMRSKAQLAAAIPGARLEVIKGSGHATPLDAPREFNVLLLDFLMAQSRFADSG